MGKFVTKQTNDIITIAQVQSDAIPWNVNLLFYRALCAGASAVIGFIFVEELDTVRHKNGSGKKSYDKNKNA